MKRGARAGVEQRGDARRVGRQLTLARTRAVARVVAVEQVNAMLSSPSPHSASRSHVPSVKQVSSLSLGFFVVALTALRSREC